MKNKLKILYTISNFDTSGSGKTVYDLAKNIDPEKFDVYISCSHNRGAFFKEIESLGHPIFIRQMTKPLRPYHTLFFRLKDNIEFIKKEKIDIVHSWHWSSDWTEVLATRIGGAKYIYTKKAMSWGNIHWKIKSFLSSFIITINEEMRDYFPRRKKQELIPFGIDTNYYSPETFPVKQNTIFKIITVANLVPVKGIEVLIGALQQLDNENIHLEIVGDDRDVYASELKTMVNRLGLENQITFLGKHIDVRPFLVQADLYVIPTLNSGRKEGMPMALVEAMSMALPVLGSNISGINFVLKSFPEMLFEASNVSELATKINTCYQQSEQERTKKGIIIRQFVIDNFSISTFIADHERLYLSLV